MNSLHTLRTAIKRSFLKWSFLSLWLTLGCTFSSVATDKPNILIILVDDAGYNDFGFMGCPDIPTPRIDRLASLGTILTDAHVTATVCSPSRAGLITGRYQQRFGHECNSPPDNMGMSPAEMTLGDVLGEAGYRTIAIGKWHLGNRTAYHPNNRGFHEFFGFLEGARSYFPSPTLDEPDNFRALLHNRRQVDFEGYLTDVLTERALRYITDLDDRPWFMYLSYNAVHTPMHAKKEHLEQFSKHPRRELAAMTWSLDENVGRITEMLESQGILEDTLIFFLSDNGGAGMNNNQSRNAPLKGWKGNKYEGGHRVPFFITWKGTIPEGKRFSGLSSALDIFATSIAAVGGQRTKGKRVDGVNLLPYLIGQQSGEPHEMLFWRKDRMAAVRNGPFKLIRLEGYGYKLYNLASDLSEAEDLCAKLPGQVSLMTKALVDWERSLSAPLWYEDENWNDVTYEIHRALMDNLAPRYKTPAQMQAFQSKKDRENK